jgi:hypothetical protein
MTRILPDGIPLSDDARNSLSATTRRMADGIMMVLINI